jgi:UDP-N-acetylglucosamine 2-epimerase (non-hydrolysing)
MTMTKKSMLQIDCIVGTRPNFVKIAPIMRALAASDRLRGRLIHTGQHYDTGMNDVFFEELGIPKPDINLEIGSGTAATQMARIIAGLEPVFTSPRPDMVLVVGDVNSTLAAAIVASQLHIPVVHVEAGLRSYDRAMPEELNRVITDQLSSLLLVTEPPAVGNLVKEGIDAKRAVFVGNVMIDTLHHSLKRAVPAAQTIKAMAPSIDPNMVIKEGFALATLHRPSNVDDPVVLKGLLEAFNEIAKRQYLIFPLHPRTRATVAKLGLGSLLENPKIITGPPLSYLSVIGLMRDAKMAITDSGGVQEETTALGVPCLTVRENTERPATIVDGTNTLIGIKPAVLIAAANDILETGGKRGRVPALWDGHTAGRIVDQIASFLDAYAAGQVTR